MKLALVIVAALLAIGCPSANPTEPTSPDEEAWVENELARSRARTGILAEKPLYSLFDEEVIIRDFFQDRREGFFVDVGCAWPIKGSNTYYLEKHLGWSGIGIDALAVYSEEWARQRPRSRFFQFLVTDRSAVDLPFFRSENPTLSSTKQHWAEARRYGKEHSVEEIRVPSITLNDLLDQAGISEIDLLTIDIEGHELSALRGIDLGRYRPGLIVVEGFRKPVLSHLAASGYEVIERYQRLDDHNTYLRLGDGDDTP